MDAGLSRQLRMEGKHQQIVLPGRHYLPVVFGQDLHLGPHFGDDGGADEDAAGGAALQALESQVGFEALHLATEGVAAYRDIHHAQAGLVFDPALNPLRHENHSRAGAEQGSTGSHQLENRLAQPIAHHQLPDGGALSARQDQRVHGGHLLRCPHGNRCYLKTRKGRQVLSHRALERQYANRQLPAPHVGATRWVA